MNPYITPADVKAVTIVQENVDNDLLTAAILHAQRIRIRPVLGKELDDRLQAHTVTPEAPPEAMDKLLAAIREAQAWWAAYESLIDIHYKVTNKGVVTKNSEPTSASAALDEIKELRSYFSERGQAGLVELATFLAENAADYPQYKPASDFSAPKTGNTGGVYLD